MVNDSFLTRWSKRKLEGDKDTQVEDAKAGLEADSANSDAAIDLTSEHRTDENLSSDVETLQETGKAQSLASLLTSEADKEIKKTALRKLFFGGEFSEVCQMNDYAQDFSTIKPLSSDVANTLRGWLKESTENSEQQEELESEQPELLAQHSKVEEAEQIEETAVEVDSELSDLEGETKNTI
ncbi:DUF3306 domain-containing protein [Vibrio sp. Y2-5]|uniref:DUF3306 domain-containing protein n=1 Tax=Vibrio sp. Y2-5 TaxID=2743977 RepID=UPI0016611986|nr:DUF3306 domain-containing protein [Vibrio sp. Y2-5]